MGHTFVLSPYLQSDLVIILFCMLPYKHPFFFNLKSSKLSKFKFKKIKLFRRVNIQKIDSSFIIYSHLGDLEPKKTFHGPELQLFACCSYLVLGLVLVAMSFSLLETQLLWKCRRMAVRLKLAHD